ncbi:MFS transporter [Lichenicoccus roseus]|uniref:MFS transporter n=1 Tax=Lichenicoccus roseus TaxID=2683649 RepID=A0A5R9IZX3_9PROT|nr:MFS transporter [Lichenicoccus roseus]TLU70822.1 MFS transporter [Lichenicoccus roseus]
MASMPTQRIETDIPARLDRLPWSRFHLMVIIALGVTWILDGLEVTIVGSIGPALQGHGALNLSSGEVGGAASAYIAGAVGGALLFGWLTDRVGRRSVFAVTLGVYVLGVLGSACSFDVISFDLSRMLTGIGIGGEYAAINSAVDEMTPAHMRGRVNLAVNASYWAGAALGAVASLLVTNHDFIPPNLGWRLGFAVGGILGLPVIWLRRFVPESPRWLVTHGYLPEAEVATARIEHAVRSLGHTLPPPRGTLSIRPRRSFGLGVVLHAMLVTHRKRSFLVMVLMLSQAFLFNAIFFTYGLVLTKFYAVPVDRIGLHILPLAAGNLFGPFILGPLFDSVGRRRMIGGTFAASSVLLVVTAVLFGLGMLDALTQTLLWMAIFFVSSSAACGAYLTASEIFPLETRAMAIAVFYAIGTGMGGLGAPYVLGRLIGTGEAWSVSIGYLIAAFLMGCGALAEFTLGIDAEGKSLEEVAEVLSA